jgi:protein SCO1/2
VNSFRLACRISIVLLFGSMSMPAAQTPLDDALGKVDFQQNLRQRISLSLPFRDETGLPVTLGRYFNDRPVLLVPGYYECPMLCRVMATGLSGALRDLSLTAGKNFEVVFFSIDPHETPALAAEKKRNYLGVYSRPGTEQGWHFLTGDSAAIRQLTDEIGFRYQYDAASKQFAHPSGIVVLTRGGVISHYLFGVSFPVEDLRAAITNASGGGVGSAVRRLILLCFHYQPLTGRYSNLTIFVLRAGALGLLLALIGWVVSAIRSEKPQSSKTVG